MKNPIRFICGVFALLGLLLCLLSAVRVFLGLPVGIYRHDFSVYKIWFNWGSLLWLIMAPIWMVLKGKEYEENEE